MLANGVCALSVLFPLLSCMMTLSSGVLWRVSIHSSTHDVYLRYRFPYLLVLLLHLSGNQYVYLRRCWRSLGYLIAIDITRLEGCRPTKCYGGQVTVEFHPVLFSSCCENGTVAISHLFKQVTATYQTIIVCQIVAVKNIYCVILHKF